MAPVALRMPVRGAVSAWWPLEEIFLALKLGWLRRACSGGVAVIHAVTFHVLLASWSTGQCAGRAFRCLRRPPLRRLQNGRWMSALRIIARAQRRPAPSASAVAGAWPGARPPGPPAPRSRGRGGAVETGAIDRVVISSLPSGMGRDRTRNWKQCERAVHLGAGRALVWAASPLLYLAALPTHPVELRARIGSCRSARSCVGMIESRPRKVIDLAGSFGRGSPAWLRRAGRSPSQLRR